MFWLDVESGKVTKIVEPKHGLGRGLKPSSWSPDSKWVTFAMNTPAQIYRVYAYSLENKAMVAITDGLTEATEPCFDAGGKYLYFLSSNDTGMSKHGFSQSAADSRQPRWSINLAVLNKDLPSPFLRESDEEKGDGEKPTPKIDKKDAGFAIDFADIDQRILSFPLPTGNYAGLQRGRGGADLLRHAPGTGRGRRPRTGRRWRRDAPALRPRPQAVERGAGRDSGVRTHAGRPQDAVQHRRRELVHHLRGR